MSTKPAEMSGEELVHAISEATTVETVTCGNAGPGASELLDEVGRRLKGLDVIQEWMQSGCDEVRCLPDTVPDSALKAADAVRQQRDAWMRACRDAIRRPMGVVPDSVNDAMNKWLDEQLDATSEKPPTSATL